MTYTHADMLLEAAADGLREAGFANEAALLLSNGKITEILHGLDLTILGMMSSDLRHSFMLAARNGLERHGFRKEAKSIR